MLFFLLLKLKGSPIILEQVLFRWCRIENYFFHEIMLTISSTISKLIILRHHNTPSNRFLASSDIVQRSIQQIGIFTFIMSFIEFCVLHKLVEGVKHGKNKPEQAI